MDRITELKVLVAIADHQGFAAAARSLDMSAPTATRAIAALESRLGTQLLVRTTRVVRLTEAGESYASNAREILAQLASADDQVQGKDGEPHGQLTVTAPAMFGRLHVVPVITAYLEQHPHTQVRAMLVDRVVDLVEEGMDVGVRIGELPSSTLRARKVGEVRNVIVGAPDYFKRYKRPRRPASLAQHTLISTAASRDWQFDGEKKPGVTPRLEVSTNDAAVEAAVSGFGITRVMSYQVAAEVASGALEVVLKNHEPPSQPVHLVHRTAPQFSNAKIRAFVDLAAETLSQRLG